MKNKTGVKKVSSYLDDCAAMFEDRGQDYGDHKKNWGCIAQMFNAYLSQRIGVDANLDWQDIGNLNALIKISRQAHKRKDDNMVDACVYLGMTKE